MGSRELQRLKATAHHEAGHAVAAWHCLVPFKLVTIAPDDTGGSLGHVLHQRPKWFHPDCELDDRTCLRAEKHIWISFAGQLAEQKFRGRKPRFGMGSDNKKAVDLAFYLCGSEETVNAYLKYCWYASRDIMNVRWKQVQALAAALLERETLHYEDALEVIMPGAAALRESLIRKPRNE